MKLSDQQINGLEPELNPFTAPAPYQVPRAGITVMIPDRKQHNAILVQDKMILSIVSANEWKKPIYFSSTVSEDNFMGMGPYLQMEGLAYRLLPVQVTAGNRVNLERITYHLDKVYRFRGLGRRRGNYDETQYGLLSNYAACFVHRAFAEREMLGGLLAQADSVGKQASADSADTALQVRYKELKRNFDDKLDTSLASIDRCIQIMPWDWRPHMLKHEILMGFNRIDEAERNAQQALESDPGNQNFIKMLAQVQGVKQRMGQPAFAAPR
jgi:hypothetical protein